MTLGTEEPEGARKADVNDELWVALRDAVVERNRLASEASAHHLASMFWATQMERARAVVLICVPY